MNNLNYTESAEQFISDFKKIIIGPNKEFEKVRSDTLQNFYSIGVLHPKKTENYIEEFDTFDESISSLSNNNQDEEEKMDHNTKNDFFTLPSSASLSFLVSKNSELVVHCYASKYVSENEKDQQNYLESNNNLTIEEKKEMKQSDPPNGYRRYVLGSLEKPSLMNLPVAFLAIAHISGHQRTQPLLIEYREVRQVALQLP